MYFSKFPVLNYPIRDKDQFKFVLARNILRRIVLSDDIKRGSSAFIEYSVKDGERPEHIADKLYGDPKYHWLVMLTNDIINPYSDWYMSDGVMQQYIDKKYSTYTLFFTDMDDRVLYSSQIGHGSTISQGSLSSKVIDYHPKLCAVTVETVGFSENYYPTQTLPRFGGRLGEATIVGLCGDLYGVKIHRVEPTDRAVRYFSQRTTNESDATFNDVVLDPLSTFEKTENFGYTAGFLGGNEENDDNAAKQISNSYRATFALLNSGQIVGWGASDTNPPSNPSQSVLSYPQNTVGAKKLYTSYYNGAVINADDTVTMWGFNNMGQSSPPRGLTGVDQMALSWMGTVALLKNGRGLTYWGDNVPSNYNFPSNPSTITKIVAGGYHFAGIRNNGDVVCWGDSSNGKTTVPTGLTAVSVSAGIDHTCALKSDGTVVCWGRNNEGQISVPVDLAGVVEIACGYRSTHALLQDNTVVSWGRNNSVSAQVYADRLNSLDLPQIVEISGVGDHLTVRTVDGSVYSVGRNNEGQCNNNLTNSVDLYQTHIGSYMGVVGQRKDTYAVSNLNYEMNRNNKRRTIRLLHPRYKDQALRELDALLRV